MAAAFCSNVLKVFRGGEEDDEWAIILFLFLVLATENYRFVTKCSGFSKLASRDVQKQLRQRNDSG
jgi:hypothetical protein